MSARVLIAALLVVCALPAPSRAAEHLRPAVDSVGMTVSDIWTARSPFIRLC